MDNPNTPNAVGSDMAILVSVTLGCAGIWGRSCYSGSLLWMRLQDHENPLELPLVQCQHARSAADDRMPQARCLREHVISVEAGG